MGIKYIKGLLLCMFIMGMYLLSLAYYNLFHTLAEGMLISLAFAVFILVIWINPKRSVLVYIGVCYLFVSLLSLFHVLAANGHYLLIDQAELESRMIYFWTINNIIQSITFLLCSIYYNRVKNTHLIGTLMLYGVIVVPFIFLWNTFPCNFIMGKGFTNFNLVVQCINAALLIISIYILMTKKERNHTIKVHDLIKGIFFLVLSVFCILLITNTTNLFNIIGHLLRIISTYYIIKTIIVHTQKNTKLNTEKPF